MRLQVIVCALLIGGSLASTTYAQHESSDIAALRAQIDALQVKLNSLEQDDAELRHVTEIGVSRLGRGEAPMVVRIYDLSDLFAVAPTYRARQASDLDPQVSLLFPDAVSADSRQSPSGAGGFGGGGGGGFFSIGKAPLTATPPESAVLAQADAGGGAGGVRTSMGNLIDAIQTIISPSEWDNVGGPGAITAVGNGLLVTASAATHQQIEALLGQFRKRWGSLRTVSVQVWWLWLTEEQLAGLLTNAPALDEKSLPAFGVIAAAAWHEHLAKIRVADPPVRPGYHAAVTCYNGQTVHVLSGGQKLLVTSIKPQWFGSEKSSTLVYQPESRLIQEGAALQVTPVTNTSGRYVILDVHSRVNVLRDRPPAPAAAAEDKPVAQADQNATIVLQQVNKVQQHQLQTHRLSTTLRIPVDQVMLLGGMSFENLPERAEPNLYLFGRVAVQELRDDVPAAEFLTPPAQDDSPKPAPNAASKPKPKSKPQPKAKPAPPATP